jgi:hypothetical protein
MDQIAEYLSSPPTLSTGTPTLLQTDVNGVLKVSVAGSGGGSVTIANTNALPQGATYVKASSAGTPITTATSVQMLAAAGAGLYYHVWVHFLNLGNTATEVQILDGSTVIYDSGAVANGGGLNDPVPIPLIGSANTALSIKTLTAGASLVWNVRGYSAAVI